MWQKMESSGNDINLSLMFQDVLCSVFDECYSED